MRRVPDRGCATDRPGQIRGWHRLSGGAATGFAGRLAGSLDFLSGKKTSTATIHRRAPRRIGRYPLREQASFAYRPLEFASEM